LTFKSSHKLKICNFSFDLTMKGRV